MAFERLNKKEAHEEANMVRAQANLDRNPESIAPKWLEQMMSGMERRSAF